MQVIWSEPSDFDLPPHLNVTLNIPIDFCGADIGWRVWEQPKVPQLSYLNLCFVVSILGNIVDTIGLLGTILYYIFVIRKYENFKARQSHGWIATGLTFAKLILVLLIGFQWTLTKLGVRFSELQGYPNFLILGDLFHMLVWLLIGVVCYLEWNRNLRTGTFHRIFFIVSAIFMFVKLHSIVNQYHVSPTTINYFNNVASNIIITIIYCLLALLSTVTYLPKISAYLDIDESQAKFKEKVQLPIDERPATFMEFLGLLSAPGNRIAMSLICVGIVTSIGKGFLMQAVNYFDGKLFDFARAGDIDSLLVVVFQTTILYLLYSIGSGVVMGTCTLGSEKIVNGANGIRNRMFAKLLKQELAYHDATTTGAIASQFSNDAERVKMILAEAIPTFVENMSLVLFGLGFLFTVAIQSKAPFLPLYMIGLVPLTFGASYYQAERLEAYEEQAQLYNAASSAKVQDVFSKYHTVIVYGKRLWEQTAYSKAVQNIYNTLRPRNIFNGVITSVTGFLSFGTQILAFFLGVELYRTVSFGAFITFCLYAMNIVFGLIEVIKLMPLIGQTIGGSNAVIRLLEREAKAPEYSAVPLLDLKIAEGAIEFRNVIFTYPNAEDQTRPTINDVSFTVEPRTKVAIIGDSGAGKTTIIQLIARFYDAQYGEILIDGQNLKNYDTASIRKHLALVGQSTGLFATTILENIAYGGGDLDDTDNVREMADILATLRACDVIKPQHRSTVNSVLQAADKASASDFVQGKLDLQLGEGGTGLSGGQRQRVTVARALYKNPQILLLDEVTSALDQVSEAVVQQAIDRLTQNRTVLIVAHRLHTIQNADKILVMEKGKIIAQGKHNDLLASSEKYRKMVAAAQQKEAQQYTYTLNSRAVDVLRDLSKEIEFEEELQALRHAVDGLVSTADDEVAKTENNSRSTLQAINDAARMTIAGGDAEVPMIDDVEDDDSDGSDDDFDDSLLPARDPRRKSRYSGTM